MRHLACDGRLVARGRASSRMIGQTWRTFDASRPARDSQTLAVHVTYAAGHVRVLPTVDRSLYDVHLRYDAERVDPVYRFDASGTRSTSACTMRQSART